jgi:hypothetical protein
VRNTWGWGGKKVRTQESTARASRDKNPLTWVPLLGLVLPLFSFCLLRKGFRESTGAEVFKGKEAKANPVG